MFGMPQLKTKLYGFVVTVGVLSAVTALAQPITDTAIIEQGVVRAEVTGSESASWFMTGWNIDYRGAATLFHLAPPQSPFFAPNDAVNLSGHASVSPDLTLNFNGVRWRTVGGTLDFSTGSIIASRGGPTNSIPFTMAGFVALEEPFPHGDLPLDARLDLTLLGGGSASGLLIPVTDATSPHFGELELRTITYGFTPGAIPEPSTWLLLASGLVGLAGLAGLRRGRKLLRLHDSVFIHGAG